MTDTHYNPNIALRFRGFLPVVVDVETGGFDAEKDALLEIAAVILNIDGAGPPAPGRHPLLPRGAIPRRQHGSQGLGLYRDRSPPPLP